MNSGKLQLKNNAEYDVVGFGDVKIKMHDGIVKTLTRMWLELKKNMIFLSVVDLALCWYTLEDEVYEVIRAFVMIIREIKHSSQYELQGKTMTCFAVMRLDVFVRKS